MNKNNELAWIEEWARWHVKLHATDTVFLFDNGSDRYSRADIEATLGQVTGLRQFAVIEFPHKFGPVDPAVRIDPYWGRFAQISSMTIVLRRFGASAVGLLNLDIDELGNAPHGRSLYDLVQQTRRGLLVLPGRWVEADRSPGYNAYGAHEQFELVHKASKTRDSSPAKWLLDPRWPWVQDLKVHPYWHWIHRRPRFGKAYIDGAHFWHFRGINTGWKVGSRPRPRAESALLVADPDLLAARELFHRNSQFDAES